MTKLDTLLQYIKKSHVYVQMHNYPDQDALASALGLKELLQAKGKEVTIVYHGIIERNNTLMMVDAFKIEIIPIENINFNSDDEIIIVDGQKGNINMLDSLGCKIACIDHHKMQSISCYLFYDIRSDVGSCSSIIASYFVENNVLMPMEIATALVYGIIMDTSHMSRSMSNLDIDMFSYLYKKANLSLLRKLETNTLKISDLYNYQKAISNLKIHGNIGISNIGNECSDAMIGTISDFLLTLSEIEFTLLYSYRSGGLKFSVRNTIETIDASKIIRQALSDYGDGGGHSDMAAGFIPNIDNEELAMEIAKKVEERVIVLIISESDKTTV